MIKLNCKEKSKSEFPADIGFLCDSALVTAAVLTDTRKLIPCVNRGADKPVARPASLCILFHSENISFDASLVIYI